MLSSKSSGPIGDEPKTDQNGPEPGCQTTRKSRTIEKVNLDEYFF